MKIRKLTGDDIHEAMNLVLAESWNQTENDWQFLVQQSDNVCLAAESEGKIIGTATAAVYSRKLAWIGMVLVNQGFRGQGIGKLLLKSILQELDHIQSVKLDATSAGLPVYKKLGFKEEYRILRMVRKPSVFRVKVDNEKQINEIEEESFPQLVRFDEEVFGVGRNDLIRYLLIDSALKGLQVIHNNKLSGLLLGRKGNKYIQIGPVSAGSSEIAIDLVSEALKEMEQHSIVVDVLEDKKELVDWLQSVGFEMQRPFVRMFYHNNFFPGDTERQYLICGPEFG